MVREKNGEGVVALTLALVLPPEFWLAIEFSSPPLPHHSISVDLLGSG